jgi:hypothetical protein
VSSGGAPGTSASTGGDTGIITNAGGTTSGGSGGTAVAGGLAAGGIDAGTRIPTAGGGASSGGAGGGDAGGVARPPLDCGPIGQPIVDAGPPKNRVNYVILADGYTSTTVETTLQTHIANAMAARFDARRPSSAAPVTISPGSRNAIRPPLRRRSTRIRRQA